MLIGIIGSKGVGKTSFASEATKYGFKKVAFAGKIKEEILAWLTENNIRHNPTCLYADDKWKNMKIDIPASIFPEAFQWGMKAHEIKSPFYTISYRSMMEYWGEYQRSLDEFHWIEKLFLSLNPKESYIIDDVRHLNEAEMITVLGGFNIRLTREDASTPSILSESELVFCPSSLTINQSAGFTLEQLKKEAESLFPSLKGVQDEPSTTSEAT